MAALLALDGHEVVTATDGAGSISKAIAQRPDLILLTSECVTLDGYGWQATYRRFLCHRSLILSPSRDTVRN
jgi:DNA-binding response OmpR family regulator